MHHRQASYHLKRSVLQHLVPPLFPNTVLNKQLLTFYPSAPTQPPVYTNATTVVPTTTAVGSTAIPTVAPTTTPIEANSGNKAFALSGASLAGLLGLAAYIL